MTTSALKEQEREVKAIIDMIVKTNNHETYNIETDQMEQSDLFMAAYDRLWKIQDQIENNK